MAFQVSRFGLCPKVRHGKSIGLLRAILVDGIVRYLSSEIINVSFAERMFSKANDIIRIISEQLTITVAAFLVALTCLFVLGNNALDRSLIVLGDCESVINESQGNRCREIRMDSSCH